MNFRERKAAHHYLHRGGGQRRKDGWVEERIHMRALLQAAWQPGSLAGHQTSDPFRFYPLRQLLPCNPSFWHRHPGRLTPHPSFVRDGLPHRAPCPICLVMLVAGPGLAGRCTLRCVCGCGEGPCLDCLDAECPTPRQLQRRGQDGFLASGRDHFAVANHFDIGSGLQCRLPWPLFFFPCCEQGHGMQFMIISGFQACV